MTLTTWRTFVTVCRLGSLSAAAEALGYTQSAVSRQVAALETEVGTRLLQRSVRGTSPTTAGEVFLRHATAVVDSAERAVRLARETAEGTLIRSFAIGAAPSLAASVVPSVLRQMIDHARPFSWTITPGLSQDLHPRLLAVELDVAVVTDAPPGVPEDDMVVRTTVGTDEMVIIVPGDHPLAGRAAVDIGKLAAATWAEDNAGSAALLRQHAARSGFTPRIEHTPADLPGKLALVAAGHAVALIPGSLVSAVRPDVTVVRMLHAPARGIYACTPRHDPHPCAAAFVDELSAAMTATNSPTTTPPG